MSLYQIGAIAPNDEDLLPFVTQAMNQIRQKKERAGERLESLQQAFAVTSKGESFGSIYKIGAVADESYFAGGDGVGEIGASLFTTSTPGMRRGKIQALNAEINSMGREMAGQLAQVISDKGVKASESDERSKFVSEVWNSFLPEWRQFVIDHDGWFENLLWSGENQIEDWTNRLIGLRAGAEQAGFRFVTPRPQIPETTGDTLMGLLKLIILVALGGVVVYALGVGYKILTGK